MGFKNNLTSNLTNKIGNSVFKIENVDGKGAMPTTIQELRERRQRAGSNCKEKIFNVINNERCSNSGFRFWC